MSPKKKKSKKKAARKSRAKKKAPAKAKKKAAARKKAKPRKKKRVTAKKKAKPKKKKKTKAKPKAKKKAKAKKKKKTKRKPAAAPADLRNVIIIGGGPAGHTAAIYSARANLKPLVFEGFMAGGLPPGGQLMTTTDVENYPGFVDTITGPDLMERFKGQAIRQGAEVIMQDVRKVDLTERPFRVWADREEPYHAKTVIVATGAKAKYLGLENEERLKNRGVSACAVCDGSLFRGKRVAVVGGGDTAMEEASYLAGLCPEVILVHRRDEFRASKAMQDRVLANKKIKVLWSHVVTDVLGDDFVTGIRVKDLKKDRERNIACDGFFLAIGHTPMTELFQGQLELHDNGYIKVDSGTTTTNLPGVFASGDAQDWIYRQAVTAAGTGCMAALEAERWLQANE